MAILGHGVDLVQTARIADLIEQHGQRFLDRCFTTGEQSYASSNPRRHVEHLAGRFAAKEAILKALGTGLAEGINWTDVEIVRLPSGQPIVQLHGRAREIAQSRAIQHWHLSITHTDTHAMASVIASA